MGLVLDKLARYEESLLAYEKAVALDPNYAPSHQRKGMALH